MKVTVSHNAGCPALDLSGIKTFIVTCRYVLGSLFVIFGPIFGMFGRRFFPWLVAVVAGFCSFGVFCLIFLVAGWMGSTAGFWCLFILSICLGVLCAWLTKKAMWFEIMLLGVISGFFAATWFYSFIVAATGWDSAVFYWCLVIPVMVACGVVAGKYYKQVIMISTSGLGAYMFCRGLSYFFGGWPSDVALFSGKVELDSFTWSFWLYWCLTIGMFFVFYCW